MPFVRKNGKGDSKYIPVPCVIGIDQSYTRTGISIAVNGKLKKIVSIDFANVKGKTPKRMLLASKVKAAIESCLKQFEAKDIVIICERIRLFRHTNSQASIYEGNSINMSFIKAAAALMAAIVDTAYAYEIPVWSADTRAWKSAVLGSSKPIFEPIEGVKDPQKFGSVRKVIELGFEDSIKRYKGNRTTGRTHWVYDDDAADSACIALYGFTLRPKLQSEI